VQIVIFDLPVSGNKFERHPNDSNRGGQFESSTSAMGTMPNLTSGSCMVVHLVAAYLPFTNTSNRCSHTVDSQQERYLEINRNLARSIRLCRAKSNSKLIDAHEGRACTNLRFRIHLRLAKAIRFYLPEAEP
jgi:hypothetical protein